MALAPSDTRSALLDAALECFASHGYEGTSIRMIAERAKRPLSLISHHFGGKEGLYVEVFRRMLTAFEQRLQMESVYRRELPDSPESALDALREIIRVLYMDTVTHQQVQNQGWEHASVLWFREFRAPRPALRDLLQSCLSPLFDRIKACLALLCPGLGEPDLRFLSISVLGIINGHSTMHGLSELIWGDNGNSGSIDRDAERLLAIALRGVTGIGAAESMA